MYLRLMQLDYVAYKVHFVTRTNKLPFLLKTRILSDRLHMDKMTFALRSSLNISEDV